MSLARWASWCDYKEQSVWNRACCIVSIIFYNETFWEASSSWALNPSTNFYWFACEPSVLVGIILICANPQINSQVIFCSETCSFPDFSSWIPLSNSFDILFCSSPWLSFSVFLNIFPIANTSVTEKWERRCILSCELWHDKNGSRRLRGVVVCAMPFQELQPELGRPFQWSGF